MNVMLVVPWDQEFGGVASVVGNLARHLQTDGHRVVFLHGGLRDPRQPRMTKWGFTAHEVHLRTPLVKGHPIKSVVGFVVYFAVTLYRIGWVIRRHDVQVVNIHYPLEAFVYLGVLRWLLPIKLVVSVHGADIFPDGRRRQRYPLSTRLLLSCADAVVAPSRTFLADCLSVFRSIRKKSVVVHNGIDLQELETTGDTAETKDCQPYLLCIAAHNEKKALEVLLDAFAQVSEVRRDLWLLLVGDGPLRRQHEELAAALSIAHRVRFLGWKPRPEVAALLHHCEVFVLPSRSEPFGMVVVEALACRKAVVASSVGGVPEIIENGRSGLLVEPDDPPALARALLRVLEDDALRRSFAEAGHARARERFGREAMGARYEALFSALLIGLPPQLGGRTD